MIEAKNLQKIYKTKKGVVVKALDGVSVKLPDTGMVFILGKSGSGKSTLLNVLGGLDSYDSGEIIIKGTSAKQFKQSHYDSYRNTYIGFIFQEYNVLEELTVGANVALAIELQGRRATNEEVNSILKEVDLDGYGSRKPNELSGGQKQRVAIARALVKKPEIIMADEPTGALDSATGKQVFDTLKKLSRDKLVLIVSHDREFSEQYADRIIELKDGVIISDVEKDSAQGQTSDIDDSIIYSENEIQVKAGYKITEQDRIAINEYLATLSSGATIKLSQGKKRVSSSDFKPTDESKIKSNKSGDFKLIKSKLSVKNAFKLGSSALKYKKIRLVITVVLSLISFTLFGLADTIAAYDNVQTATNSIYDTGVDYLSFSKMIKNTNGDYTYWTGGGAYLTVEDVNTIKEKTGQNVVGVYKKDVQLNFDSNLGNKKTDGFEPDMLFSNSFSGVTAITSSIMAENGFTFLGTKSRLPEKDKNEIVITKYTYDYFANVGYKGYDSENGEYEKEINSYDDLIGEELALGLSSSQVGNPNTKGSFIIDGIINSNQNGANYKIVGIVDTGFDYSRYEPLASTNVGYELNMIEQMALQSELEGIMNYSFASVLFVNDGMFNSLVNSAKGSAENLSYGGSFQLYMVENDSFTSTEALWRDEENVIQQFWFNYINSATNVKDDIIWLGSELTSLNDNQVIVSSQMLKNLLSLDNTPDVFYNSDLLKGFEKTIFTNYQEGQWNCQYYPDLQNFFAYPKYFAVWQYATDEANYETVRDAVEDLFIGKYGWDEEFANQMLADRNSVYSFFVQEAYNGNFEEEYITDAYVQSYVNRLIETYNLSKYKLPESVKDALIVSTEYNGKTYYSYDRNALTFTFQLNNSYDLILMSKYVYENFDDAVAYYEYMLEARQEENMPFDISMIVSAYESYLRGDKIADGYQSIATESYQTFLLDEQIALYKAFPSENKLVATYYSSGKGYDGIVKNIEIVGVLNSDSVNYSTVIVSDSIMKDLFGKNLGGIYAFAVGAMPNDKNEIRTIVDFSYNYLNADGDVKYSLKNNVTEQLSMVDELLDVLGQVFLYVGIGFAVFASLMLANFISTSVSHKKQEIGILRAIGSRSADVFRIFFAESFIIAMINYLLAVVGTGVATFFINGALRNDAGLLITFLNFGIRQIGLLLLVSLGVAFIATFLPVKKIASMKPIDAIKNRK